MTSEGGRRDRLTRTFADIAHTLESSDESDARITRTLDLLNALVPYRYCALYSMPSRTTGQLYVVPPLADGHDRDALARKLVAVLRTTVNGLDDDVPVSERRAHLTLPVVGLDRVIGVVRLEPPDAVEYEAEHVSLLSIVCAQLGSYLTGLQLQSDQTRRLKDLQAAHDFQRLLVAVVGHDLRNPLGVILASATMLAHSDVAPENHVQTSTRIQRNVRRAAKIIDDLLDLTQIQLGGGLPLRPRRTDLVKLVEELTADLQLAEPTRSIRMETTEAAVEIDCDPDRLAQVITNLLGNAIRYGSSDVPVRVRIATETSCARVSVHNGGAPIAADLLPVIFDPFRRGAGSAATAKHSLGLGLYIVAEIVRSHGGDIVARSDEQETAFTVTLPRQPQASHGAPFSRVPSFG